jgi:glycosyltransferase involved in cell wall biosynthesis
MASADASVSHMSRRPAIAVVIPARDARATVSRCIECLAAQQLEHPWEAVLVDNGSSDGTAEMAADTAARCDLSLRIERLPRGRGPAAPRNHGAAVTTAPALAFLDADCFATRGWLAAGLRSLADADLVQGRVVPDRDFVRGPFDRTLHVNGPSPLFETANLFVTRSLFERVGGFEDWLEPGIARPVAEDVWFGWNAVRAGARREYTPDALVEHAVFREGAVRHVLERRRLAHFPALAARIPELREEFFFGRWFLNRRTAAFDLALLAIATRRRALAPLALPYLSMFLAEALPWRRLAPKVVPVRLAADAVGLAALLRGSVRSRHVVI